MENPIDNARRIWKSSAVGPGFRIRTAHAERSTGDPALSTAAAASLNLAQPPKQTRPPNGHKSLWAPSQGALQLNQATQPLYVDRPVILTSKGCAAAYDTQQQ
ncbi:hypothetical protein PGT21_011932 [Puccinia graminis f. sp. tritici]|uniref:Uncharacterized protein n=1 Tax=Puccinia graminis f. sp. tritici TaxID=56615 RepID=A0A5B0Q5I4_PUCGR|nr:hypothetical protein PGT21_011932 [Puccinia graminis f. sp. tritici]